MANFKKIIATIVSAAVAAGVLAFPAQAATTVVYPLVGESSVAGPWTVTNLAADHDGWIMESYKVDRDLTVWTEANAALKQRQLRVFDGLAAKTLATIPFEDWNDADISGFVDPVAGSYDAADGLVVWIQRDGSQTNDREVFGYDGAKIYQVSNNTYDDKHPVTSAGRVAWTSSPTSQAYNLMLRDIGGMRRLDSWQVLNYKFSGASLFWLNQRPGENWFRVFRNTGNVTVSLEKGDDRPIRDYFMVDGKGGVAWEYSTKQWAYDKREIFSADKGFAKAVRVFQRDVPPNVTRVEALKSGRVLVNNTDLLTTLLNKSSLVRADGSNDKYLAREYTPTKARFTATGIVRHLVADSSSALIVLGDNGGQDYVSFDHVILDRFESDGDVVAGALLKGGVVTRVGGDTYNIPSPFQASSIAVRGDTIVWMEANGGVNMLRTASRRVTVYITNDGSRQVSGHLVNVAGSPMVYLAANDGNRYLVPTEEVFRTWYPDFASLRPMAKADLAAMPLAGSLGFKPGSLVKSASSVKVYLAGTDGALHPVRSANVLSETLGKDWNARLVMTTDVVLGSYPSGADVKDAATYREAMKQ